MGISYMDDNSTAVGENGADSRAMNPNNIVERVSADSSEKHANHLQQRSNHRSQHAHQRRAASEAGKNPSFQPA